MKLPFDFDISMLYEISFLHGKNNTTYNKLVLMFTCVKETQKLNDDDDTNS